MADEKDNPIDIEIEEDKPLTDADVVIEEPEKKPETPSVDDEIAKLKASVDSANARAAQAEQRERDATNVAVARTNEVAETNLNLVSNAIGTLNMAQEALETNLASAFEVGDHTAASSIQREISRNEAKLAQLESGKQQMEAAPKVTAPQPTGDPVEAVASDIARGGAPRSAEWVRNHPEYVRDQRLNARMLAAHNLAITDGLQVDSDAYFNAVETTLGIRGQDNSAYSDASQPAQRRAAPAAAPVSRSGTGDGRQTNRVTLSAEEREMAQMSGLSEQEWARNKLALMKEGVLGKPN